jgi:hypothetical protein
VEKTRSNKENLDPARIEAMIMDSLHRIIVHYGLWFGEVQHQLGLAKALEVEQAVWKASMENQMARLGKVFGFSMEEGIPSFIQPLSEAEGRGLLEKISINWLANDGIWFQAVEQRYGMNDAKRCNDTCWTRFSPFEAYRIKQVLGLPENGGIQALKAALNYRLYARINEQSIEDVNETCIIFRMESCRVQAARKRRGLDDYPCKSAGMVEYPSFGEAIDSRIRTECIGCPPDGHPDAWYCAWKFTMEE